MNLTSDQVELDEVEQELLVWQVSNELMNGFHLSDFEAKIGLTEEAYADRINVLRVSKGGTLRVVKDDISVLRNALTEVLTELGFEEFHTRTGHDFAYGEMLLRRLSQKSNSRSL